MAILPNLTLAQFFPLYGIHHLNSTEIHNYKLVQAGFASLVVHCIIQLLSCGGGIGSMGNIPFVSQKLKVRIISNHTKYCYKGLCG